MEEEQIPLEEQEEPTVESSLSKISAKVSNATKMLQEVQTDIAELYESLEELDISNEGATTK